MVMWSLPSCTTDSNHGFPHRLPTHCPQPHNVCKVAQHHQEAGNKKLKTHDFTKAPRKAVNEITNGLNHISNLITFLGTVERDKIYNFGPHFYLSKP